MINTLSHLLSVSFVLLSVAGCAGERGAQAMPVPATPAADRSLIHVIPYPQSVTLGVGRLTLSASARIVTTDSLLAPLAQVFQGELLNVTGLKLAVASGVPKSGDIVLGIDTTQKTGGYSLVVADKIVVGAADYKGAAAATATILQALDMRNGAASLPTMTIVGYPHADYCAAMEDVARKPHTLEQLRQCVDVCRLYKIRYFHLHLTDDQLWTFPSTKYPQLVADGYTIIICPWWLGCDWDDLTMYMSNFIWLKKSDAVLGATMVHWEQPGIRQALLV